MDPYATVEHEKRKDLPSLANQTLEGASWPSQVCKTSGLRGEQERGNLEILWTATYRPQVVWILSINLCESTARWASCEEKDAQVFLNG